MNALMRVEICRRDTLNLFRNSGFQLESFNHQSSPSIVINTKHHHPICISGNGCSLSRTAALYPERMRSIPNGCALSRTDALYPEQMRSIPTDAVYPERMLDIRGVQAGSYAVFS
jgi:hypothetical protein